MPCAEPKQANGSIAEEMASLPDDVMNLEPSEIAYRAEDGLVDYAQRAIGMIGTEKFG